MTSYDTTTFNNVEQAWGVSDSKWKKARLRPIDEIMKDPKTDGLRSNIRPSRWEIYSLDRQKYISITSKEVDKIKIYNDNIILVLPRDEYCGIKTYFYKRDLIDRPVHQRIVYDYWIRIIEDEFLKDEDLMI